MTSRNHQLRNRDCSKQYIASLSVESFKNSEFFVGSPAGEGSDGLSVCIEILISNDEDQNWGVLVAKNFFFFSRLSSTRKLAGEIRHSFLLAACLYTQRRDEK